MMDLYTVLRPPSSKCGLLDRTHWINLQSLNCGIRVHSTKSRSLDFISKGAISTIHRWWIRDGSERWRDLRRWSDDPEGLKINQYSELVRTSVHMPTEIQLIPATPCSNPSQNSWLLGVSMIKCWCSTPWHCDWWIKYWLFVNYRKLFSDVQLQLLS